MATARRDGSQARGRGPRGRVPSGCGWQDRSGWSEARRRIARRGAGLGAIAVAALSLSACGEETTPYSTIDPATEIADDIQGLYKLVFWMALVVFVGVQFLIFYTALRFRQKRRLADRPEQIHGNTRLELTWTIIPAIVLLIIFVPTVVVMYDAAAEADEDEGAFVVEAYGKQWWWEFHYPDIEVNGEPLVTANEMRVPVGEKVIVKLLSNNVIHSFWVPQLQGKMDIIPGYINELAFTPEIPGTYYGECAEFCGTGHAWMRFTVIVEPREQFDTWVAAWQSPPPVDANPETADLVEAPASFGACIGCHRINGTSNANLPLPTGYVGGYVLGPNLTLFGCRDFFAGGIMETNEENLRAWLDNPLAIKDGNLMGTVIQDDTLTPEQIDELVPYLLGLTMPGGVCPEDAGAAGAATPVAAAPVDPAAGDVVAAGDE